MTRKERFSCEVINRTDDNRHLWLGAKWRQAGVRVSLTVAARCPDDITQSTLSFTLKVKLSLKYPGACPTWGERTPAGRTKVRLALSPDRKRKIVCNVDNIPTVQRPLMVCIVRVMTSPFDKFHHVIAVFKKAEGWCWYRTVLVTSYRSMVVFLFNFTAHVILEHTFTQHLNKCLLLTRSSIISELVRILN